MFYDIKFICLLKFAEKPELTPTKAILGTTEMRILKIIKRNTLRDRIPNMQIRDLYGTQDVIRWITQRRRGWNNHVTRMAEDRMVTKAKDGRPDTRKPPGRPPKQWRDSWTSTS